MEMLIEKLPIASTLTIVDVGANPIDGPAPYANILPNNRVKLFGFEPNPEALKILNDSKGDNETYFPFALADGNIQKFYICKAPGMSSIFEPNQKVLSLFHGFPEWGEVLSILDIDTKKLDDIPDIGHIDFLKIDVQGAELMIMENGRSKLEDCLVIQTEIEFIEMYHGQPLFSELEHFLRQMGFMLHKFNPIVSRIVKPLQKRNDLYAGLSQQLWSDAIFVKNYVDYASFSDDQLLKYSIILHDIYGSKDVVLRTLIEYDKRSNTDLSKQYASNYIL